MRRSGQATSRALGTRLRVTIALLLGALAAALLAASMSAPVGGAAQALLPDLDQSTPFHIQVVTRTRSTGRVFRLGFGSSVENVGDGPLIVDGRRAAGARDMTAEQIVRHSNGSSTKVPDVGTLRYTVSPDHRHWHYRHFDRYELRRGTDRRRVRGDLKTGFCLGDRYESTRPVSAKPQYPRYLTTCGLGAPQLRYVREGISPGYGDDYAANLEGQEIDVTGLPAGEYILIHRANADRKLRETDYTNNAASVRLRITWPNGMSQRPRITRVRTCPGTATC